MQIDDISKVVKSGTGLAFISYPDAISKFEYLPQVKSFEKKNDEKFRLFKLKIVFLRSDFLVVCGALLFHAVHTWYRIRSRTAKCRRYCAM